MNRSGVVALSMATVFALANTSRAEDAYLVGVTAGMTGPLAGLYTPVTDGIRIYIDRLDAAGGINGKPIRLVIHDDQADATKAAANVKRLTEEENFQLLVNNSGSSTYQPTMAEVKRAGVPLLFVGACPNEVYPPAEPLMFCTNSFTLRYDAPAALDYIKEAAGTTDIDLGLMSLALPVARAEVDYAEAQAKKMGMHPVDKELLPLATSDFTPYATKLSAAKPQWIRTSMTWDLQTGALAALRRLGWTGKFLGWSHVQAEEDLPRVNDLQFYVIGTNAYFFQHLPVQDDILAAAKTAGLSYPATRLTEGWIAGMAIEAAFKSASAKGPVTPATVASTMETLTIDTLGLRGTPITWTKTNHFRTVQSYRVYRWNGTSLEAVDDWHHYDVR
jgi:branched-chain amino acid transport system substrate-binding protein